MSQLTVHGVEAVLAFALAARAVAAQSRAIEVRPLGLVSADAPNVNHAEAWLAIDPTNSSHALVASLADSGAGSVVYRTLDGGRTWKRGSPESSTDQSFPGGDPVVVFDHQGHGYLATISPFRVWRSTDGGVTWSGPTLVPGRAYDREFLAVRSSAAGPDTIYALAKTPVHIIGHLANDMLAVARSTDGAVTFEAPRFLLPDPTKSIVHTAGGLVAAPNGDLLFSFLAHDVPVTDNALVKNHVWLVRWPSGREMPDPVPVATSVIHGNQGDQVKMIKSLALAGLALDTAGKSPYRGRLYVSFMTVLDDRLQVMVVASGDTGRTWSAPVRVNDDRTAANHSNPMMAIDERGVLAVVWNDRRADPADLCFRARVSASLDGGRTFLPSTSLESHDVCPVGRELPSLERLSSFGGRYLNGGESQAFSALPGGGFLVVYLAKPGKAVELRAAAIDVPGAPNAR